MGKLKDPQHSGEEIKIRVQTLCYIDTAIKFHIEAGDDKAWGLLEEALRALRQDINRQLAK